MCGSSTLRVADGCTVQLQACNAATCLDLPASRLSRYCCPPACFVRHSPTNDTTATATQIATPSLHAPSARSDGTAAPSTVDTCSATAQRQRRWCRKPSAEATQSRLERHGRREACVACWQAGPGTAQTSTAQQSTQLRGRLQISRALLSTVLQRRRSRETRW
jgi:hypothetical protein